MVKRKTSKSNKMRGSRTYGYGSHKKHRGGGSRGGRGMAGIKNQKKTWMLKNKPNHLGKRGFKSLAQRKIAPRKKFINVCDLEVLSNSNKELDLSKLGYNKVLGSGSISKPIIVKAEYFTKAAREKIEKAKGKAVAIGSKGESVSNTQ